MAGSGPACSGLGGGAILLCTSRATYPAFPPSSAALWMRLAQKCIALLSPTIASVLGWPACRDRNGHTAHDKFPRCCRILQLVNQPIALLDSERLLVGDSAGLSIIDTTSGADLASEDQTSVRDLVSSHSGEVVVTSNDENAVHIFQVEGLR